MGAKESIMKDVELGECLPTTCQLYKMWTELYPGLYRSSQKASIFVRDFVETDSDETRTFFDNGIQTLKQLRHPSILSYYGSGINSVEAVLITERVQPLDLVLEDLVAVEIIAGLKNILDALIFIHDKAGRCHNNISPSACFVSPGGEWKLGSFECSQRMENTRHWVASDFAKEVKESAFLPPEDQMMQKDVPAHARDSYGFGKLVEYTLPYFDDSMSEEQKSQLNDLIESLTNDDASKRPQLGAFQNSTALRNELSDIMEFLRNLLVKKSEEKTEFFSTLVPRMISLPSSVIARRLIKLLLSRYVLLEYDAVRHVLPSLLTVKEADENTVSDVVGVLPKSLFEHYVVPELSRIFCVHEVSVRLSLLAYFDRYIIGFEKDTLENVILPELLLGMKDTDEQIVAASMRCLADLIPLLGAPIVTGLEHKKYFAEGKPRDKITQTFAPVASLKNIKEALESDKTASEIEIERKELRRQKIEERKRIMEERKRSLEEKKEKKAVFADKISSEIVELPDKLITVDLVETEESIKTKQTEEVNDDSDPDWADWTPAEQPTPQRQSVHSSKSSDNVKAQTVPAAIKPRTKRLSLNEQPLGIEFDVMALEVDKVKTPVDPIEELNFFADMEPSIGSKNDKPIAISSKPPSNMFQMAITDTGGNNDLWDDEASWENQD